MQELVQVYKALSDPTRLRMLHLLTHQPLCVCHFQGILNLAQVPVSQHLAYLRKTGLVEDLRPAQWKVYRLKAALSPERRVVLDALTKAAQTQVLLVSDLKRMEGVLRDPRYAFCGHFATPKQKALPPARNAGIC